MRAELDCAGAVELTLSEQVRLPRFVGGSESTQAHLFPVEHDVRSPSRPPAGDAQIAGGAVHTRVPEVLLVFRHGHVPQVTESVVLLSSVDMVDIARGPCASHVEPRQPMRLPGPTENSYLTVTGWVKAASYVADLDSVACTHAPYKHPSLWIVIKKFAQTLCGELSFAHDAVLLRQLMGSGASWLQPRRTAQFYSNI